MDFALKNVGLAADTIFCPRRVEGQPQRRVVLIEVNEVKDTTAYGGGVSQSDCRRQNKFFTVVGPESRKDVCDIIKQTAKPSLSTKRRKMVQNYTSSIAIQTLDLSFLGSRSTLLLANSLRKRLALQPRQLRKCTGRSCSMYNLM